MLSCGLKPLRQKGIGDVENVTEQQIWELVGYTAMGAFAAGFLFTILLFILLG